MFIYEELELDRNQIQSHDFIIHIYKKITEYFQMKKYAKCGGTIDKYVYLELRKVKNQYITYYIEKYKIIREYKEDKLYKSLYYLIFSLFTYTHFMSSIIQDEFKQEFLEYDILTALHIFHHLQKMMIDDFPILLTH